MRFLPLLLNFATLALAGSRTTAPSGALTVGAGQKYSSISKAVSALSLTSTTEQTIFIHPGTYQEQVYIPKLNGPLTVYGYTKDDTSYTANQVTIVASESQKSQPNNDATATLRVWTSDFKLYNVNVKNAFGQGSQAVAVSAAAGQQGYYGCSLLGYQDTLLANEGTQIYAKTYIEGATDFIFGQRAQAWFEQCTIGVVAASKGWVTASGRSSDDAGWYVINKSRVGAAPGNSVKDGAYYLGRPWRNYARVVFQQTEMSKVINGAGWSVWNEGDERTDKVYFAESENTGAGATGNRAPFSKKIASPVKIETVLGAGYASAKYVDAKYLK